MFSVIKIPNYVFHDLTLILISKYRDIAKIVCRKNFQKTFTEMPYMLKFYTCSILSVVCAFIIWYCLRYKFIEPGNF